MAHQITITKRAKKDIDKLDVVAKKRLKKALLSLQIDPLSQSKKLIDSRLGRYRYRIGDYRVIYDLNDDEIIILRVGHRREIYR